MLSIVKKTISSVVIIVLLITNILSLTNSKVHDALYGALSMLNISDLIKSSPTNKIQKLKKKNITLKKDKAEIKKIITKNKTTMSKVVAKNKAIAARISTRVVRNSGMNLLSVPVEAVPIIGIASIVLVTAKDLHDACETMKDIEELLLMGDKQNRTTDTVKVCGQKAPTVDEVMESLDEKYRGINDAIGGTIYEILN